MPVSCPIWALFYVLAALFPTQLPGYGLANPCADGPDVWGPAAQVGHLDEAPASCIQPAPALAMVATWVNQQKDPLSFPPFLSLTPSLFELPTNFRY